MNRLAVALASCVLTACAAGDIPRSYSGDDAGFLIVALATTPNIEFTNYNLLLRTKDKAHNTFVAYLAGKPGFLPLLDTKRDFDDANENGAVFVRSLPAGDYEIYNFRAAANNGFVEKNFSSKMDVSIPFSIRPGRATYVGDFRAFPFSGQNIFGVYIDTGVYFLVADRSDRDIPIAKSKMPAPVEVDRSVIDVDKLGSPLFRTSR